MINPLKKKKNLFVGCCGIKLHSITMGAFSTSNYSFMKLQLLALFFYQLPVCAVKYEQACISAEMSIEQHSFFGVCAGHVRDHQSAV